MLRPPKITVSSTISDDSSGGALQHRFQNLTMDDISRTRLLHSYYITVVHTSSRSNMMACFAARTSLALGCTIKCTFDAVRTLFERRRTEALSMTWTTFAVAGADRTGVSYGRTGGRDRCKTQSVESKRTRVTTCPQPEKHNASLRAILKIRLATWYHPYTPAPFLYYY